MGSFQEDLAANKQNFESKLDGKMSYYYAPYHKMSESDKKKVNQQFESSFKTRFLEGFGLSASPTTRKKVPKSIIKSGSNKLQKTQSHPRNSKLE